MHGHGGYDSDFSDDEHCGESSKRKKRTTEDDLLLQKPFQKEKHGKVVHKQVAEELLDRENDKTDMDVIRENHRFLWNEEDEVDMNWRKEVKSKKRKDRIKKDCEESPHKKSRLSSAEGTSKKKDKGKGELGTSKKKDKGKGERYLLIFLKMKCDLPYVSNVECNW
ncbi:Protein FRA10AC1 [Myotis davidii]|uniref:Protein FRA10AC1 n=1 Tax=Myotis davidii TaxID=225400 RepID=L5MEF2_MYODS|nr:Protein FRA10AC1 [Myotis davidii]